MAVDHIAAVVSTFSALLLPAGCGWFGAGAPSTLDIETGDGGVPSVAIDYEMDVRDFWEQHPANPESDNYLSREEIEHPEPLIDVSADHRGDVAAAIEAAMAAGGGTLLFGEGTYALPAGTIHLHDTNGVHFIGEGQDKTTLRAAGRESGIDILRTSTRYREAIDAGEDPGEIDVIETYEDPDALDDQVRDFYFEGITFDGGGVSGPFVALTAAEDAWFRDCTFRDVNNEPASGHTPFVGSHAWSNNIWFEGCTFQGTANHVIVLDGTHGSGVVDCDIGFDVYPTALEFWSNYDCTHRDAYKDGSSDVYEPQEVRMGRYIVVDGCRFGATGEKNVMAISAKASDVLITRNRMGPKGGHYFVKWSSGYGSMPIQLADGLDYIYRDLFVIDNDIVQVNQFLVVSGSQGAARDDAETRIGGYTVRNNTVGSVFVGAIVIENDRYVDGPNEVSGNSWQ